MGGIPGERRARCDLRAFLMQHWPPIWPGPRAMPGPTGRPGAVTGWDLGRHRRHPSRGGPLLPVQAALQASVISGGGASCCLWSCEQPSAVRRVHFRAQRFCYPVPGLGVFLKVGASLGHGPSHPVCYRRARGWLF